MSAVSSLFHIVINTLRRELTIPDVVFKVPLRGTFDLLHTTKLRGPSALLHGLSYKWLLRSLMRLRRKI